MEFTAITVIYLIFWHQTMTSNEIAKIIHYCRKKSGLTQQELAKLAGVGKTVIFDIEKGKKTVQLNTLLKVLDILNIQIKLETPFAQNSGE
jgi:HTH-type transcriptional regulator / antitoxin HipB